MADEYPANSQRKTSRPRDNARDEPKKVEKVITGPVVERKKSWVKRFGENFLGGDAQSVGSYIMFDVAVPAAKDMLYDMVSQGFERTLFGESRPSRRSGSSHRSRTSGYTPYNQMGRPSHRDDPRPGERRRSRSSMDVREIVLGTRREGELVLSNLDELIDRYGSATVADFYDLCDVERIYTDDKFGWHDLSQARIRHVSGGFLIDLPRPESLE